MTANVDQILAQGMDAATLHIWDYETVKPAVQEAINKGIIMTSFFSPLGDSGIPTARSDEAGISFDMGVEMATQWKATLPDTPIVMAELGWPNHTKSSPDVPILGSRVSSPSIRPPPTSAASMPPRDLTLPSRSSSTWSPSTLRST